MANRTKLTIDWLNFEGSSATNNPTDSDQIKLSVEETSVDEIFRRREAIADGVIDQVIPIPDTATDYLMIFCDYTISIKLNGSSDALTLSPKASGTKAPLFVMKGDINALTLSNSSGSIANVDIIAINV